MSADEGQGAATSGAVPPQKRRAPDLASDPVAGSRAPVKEVCLRVTTNRTEPHDGGAPRVAVSSSYGGASVHVTRPDGVEYDVHVSLAPNDVVPHPLFALCGGGATRVTPQQAEHLVEAFPCVPESDPTPPSCAEIRAVCAALQQATGIPFDSAALVVYVSCRIQLAAGGVDALEPGVCLALAKNAVHYLAAEDIRRLVHGLLAVSGLVRDPE